MTDSKQNIRISLEGNLAYLTFCRPEKRNAINDRTLAELRDFLRKALVERFERPFGRVIKAGDRGGIDPRNARDADDMAALLRTQKRKGCLDNSKRAENIGVELGANLGLAGFLDRADERIAGIVQDDIQTAEMRVRRRNDFGNLIASAQGTQLTRAEHPTGWGQTQCFLCHPVDEIHKVDRSGTGTLPLEDIRRLVDRDRLTSCHLCHGDNGVDR